MSLLGQIFQYKSFILLFYFEICKDDDDVFVAQVCARHACLDF